MFYSLTTIPGVYVDCCVITALRIMYLKVRIHVTALLLLLGLFIPADCKLHLRYFDSRGRAEPIRLLLAVLELPYEETVFARCGDTKCPEGLTDWPAFKAKHMNTEILPFGQVPSLTYTDLEGKEIHLVQSLAIQMFLAKKFSFIADDSEANKIRTDIIAGGLEDMRKKYGALVYNPSFDFELLEKYKKETQEGWLPFFERLLGENESVGPGFVGNKFSFIDTLAFDMLESNLRIDPTCLDSLPKLVSFFKRVANIPGITRYIKSEGRRPHSNGNTAFYDTPEKPIPVTHKAARQYIEKEL